MTKTHTATRREAHPQAPKTQAPGNTVMQVGRGSETMLSLQVLISAGEMGTG
jgi:hypothetical protein